MAKISPEKRDSYAMVGILLVASVFFPTIGLVVAGAKSTTVKRLYVCAYIAFIAAGVMAVDWGRRAGVLSIADSSTALQLTFNIVAGAVFLCFGIFYASVAGSIAFSKFMSGQKNEIGDAPRWVMIAVCLFFGGLILTARQLDTNIEILEAVSEKTEKEISRLEAIARDGTASTLVD